MDRAGRLLREPDDVLGIPGTATGRCGRAAMIRTLLEAILRRFLLAVAFAVLGFGLGMPAGPLAGAAVAGTWGLVAGLVEGDPFTSAGSWLQMAVGFWGGPASLYVG